MMLRSGTDNKSKKYAKINYFAHVKGIQKQAAL